MRYAKVLVVLAMTMHAEAGVHALTIPQDSTKQPITKDTAGTPLNLDEQLFLGINHWGSDGAWLDGPAVFLSNTAFYAVLATPVAIYGYGRATRSANEMQAGLSTLLSVGAASLLTEGIKYLVQRERPYRVLAGWRTPDSSMLPTDYSFPSGHATATWAFASALSFHYPKWYVIAPAAFYAFSVSLSRPYVAAHYPSDIIAGAAIGIATSYAFWRLEPRLFAKAGNLVAPRNAGSPPSPGNSEGTLFLLPLSFSF